MDLTIISNPLTENFGCLETFKKSDKLTSIIIIIINNIVYKINNGSRMERIKKHLSKFQLKKVSSNSCKISTMQ